LKKDPKIGLGKEGVPKKAEYGSFKLKRGTREWAVRRGALWGNDVVVEHLKGTKVSAGDLRAGGNLWLKSATVDVRRGRVGKRDWLQ